MTCDHNEAIAVEAMSMWCPACGALALGSSWRAPTGARAIANENPNDLVALAERTVRDLRTRIGVDVALVFVCRTGDGMTGAALDTGVLPYSTGAMIAVEGVVNCHNAVLRAMAAKVKEDR